MTWLLDLDGVVWRGEEAIDGSVQAIERLQDAGIGILYVTNNSAITAEGYIAKLSRLGIRAFPQDVIHGGHATIRLIEPGWRVLCCCGDGIVEVLQEAGVDIVHADDVSGLAVPRVDAVIIGWTPDFEYRRLNLAARAVLNGARLLSPTIEPLYPASDGFNLGGGSLTAAVAYATKAEPTFAGKPYPAMVEAVRSRISQLQESQIGYGQIEILVGDQPATDGLLAERLGVPFALVHSGVTAPDRRSLEVPMTLEAPDLAAVVDAMVSAVQS